MTVLKTLSSLSRLEIFLIIIFLFIVLLPYQIPFWLGFIIDSSFGFILLFLITLALFYYFNPILGVLFIFVCYELLRRSSSVLPVVPMIQYTPTQDKKDEQMLKMNPIKATTLEEEIIATNAPLDGSKSKLSLVPEMTSYKPLSANVSGSSVL